MLCVRGDNGGAPVCQLPGEGACAYDSECLGAQTCGPDRKCRDACSTDRDCIKELVCAGGVCAKPEELRDGKLPELSPASTGTTCTRSSDCPAELVCRRGACGRECFADKDCTVGWTCRTVSLGGDGKCIPEMDIPVSLGAGFNYTCVKFKSGRLKCWGMNRFGLLGLGDSDHRGDEAGEMGDALPYVNLGSGRTVQTHYSGLVNNCAILDNGALKCWGYNADGALGIGDTDNRGDDPNEMGDQLPSVDLGSGLTAKSVAPGFKTCAILSNDQLKCWGTNVEGALGLGDTRRRGAIPGEMGDALPPIQLGGARPLQVEVGYLGSCAMLDNGTAKCWGWNEHGELGRGDTLPWKATDPFATIDLGTGRTVRSIAVLASSNCALLDNGMVKCWGDGDEGALGLPDLESRGDNPGEMGDALPPVNLGPQSTVKSLVGGISYVCAVLGDNTVKCWGGDVSIAMGGNPVRVDLGTGRTVKAVTVGASHACAILDNDKVKCWGDNNFGQLGLGDTKSRYENPADMGDNLPYVKLTGP